MNEQEQKMLKEDYVMAERQLACALQYVGQLRGVVQTLIAEHKSIFDSEMGTCDSEELDVIKQARKVLADTAYLGGLIKLRSEDTDVHHNLFHDGGFARIRIDSEHYRKTTWYSRESVTSMVPGIVGSSFEHNLREVFDRESKHGG